MANSMSMFKDLNAGENKSEPRWLQLSTASKIACYGHVFFFGIVFVIIMTLMVIDSCYYYYYCYYSYNYFYHYDCHYMPL